MTIQSDAAGKPSGNVLASTTITGLTRFPRIVFADPASLSAGVRYHVVFVNTDASPHSNFISANAFYVWDTVSPRQPMYGNDWAVLYDMRLDRASQVHHILQAGLHQRFREWDRPYMECWQTVQPAIGDSKKVCELNTVSGSNRQVPGRVVRVTQVGCLTIRLESRAGSLIEAGPSAKRSWCVDRAGRSRRSRCASNGSGVRARCPGGVRPPAAR